MAKFYKFAGKSPKFKEYKFKPQKVPKQTSAFDDALKKTRVDRIRSTFGESMPKSFYERPPVLSVAKERAEKVGRRVTESGLKRLTTIRKAAAQRIKLRRSEFGKERTKFFQRTNKGIKQTPFAKKVKTKIEKLQTKAVVLADKRGAKATARMEQKLGIATGRPKDRPSSFYQRKVDVPAQSRREDEFIKKLRKDMGF